MKYLLFSLEYPPFNGGVGNYYKNLVDHWPDNNIRVLTHGDNKTSTEKISRKKLISSFLYPKWLISILHLYKIIKKESVNYVIVGHILPLGTVAYFLAKFLNFKYAVVLHGMDFTFALKKKRKEKMAIKILMDADKIICGNNYVAGLIKGKVGERAVGKIQVINPGIDKSKLSLIDKGRQKKLKEKYGLHNKFTLFSLGRLVERKGFDKVIESMPRILEKEPNLEYLVAGEGPFENKLKKRCLKILGSRSDKVIFLGGISEEDKWNLLDLSNIFIMPSRNIEGDFEGFGIVYLEASLTGTPVIAGNDGGVADAVNENNGILVNPHDKKEITDATIKLIKDKKLRKKLGEEGRDRILKHFNWQSRARKFHDFLNN